MAGPLAFQQLVSDVETTSRLTGMSSVCFPPFSEDVLILCRSGCPDRPGVSGSYALLWSLLDHKQLTYTVLGSTTFSAFRMKCV